jgi:4-aminobutyrate aminotransferase/(S)-3-amino-2-methylpropionate transaminase
VAVQAKSETERVIEARDRFVARGLATPPVVVSRASGARIWDVDGREYVDFAGGLGCLNTGHGFGPALQAVHEQVDLYMHQCVMVGLYEPYVEVCRLLAELSPCAGADQKSVLVNSGAEAVENAVKIARAATGRPGVVVFDHAFHGRTLLTMAMTSKLVYKRGFGPFAPEIYRAPGPYPYRGVDSDAAMAGLERLFASDVDPASVACVVLEPVQGEGGFIVMPPDFPRRLKDVCEQHAILYVDDEVQSGIGRTGPVFAIEHYGVEPDLVVTGKSLGGGLPLAGVTGRAEVMDAVHPGGLGGTFGGNPVACAAAIPVLEAVGSREFRARAEEVGMTIRARLDGIAERMPTIGEVRGLGPMLALELVVNPETKEPAAPVAQGTAAAARERGLILLTCGFYGNVVRILVPLVATDEDIREGLDILEESLVAATAV